MRRDWDLIALLISLVLVIGGVAASFVVRPYLTASAVVPAPPQAIPNPLIDGAAPPSGGDQDGAPVDSRNAASEDTAEDTGGGTPGGPVDGTGGESPRAESAAQTPSAATSSTPASPNPTSAASSPRPGWGTPGSGAPGLGAPAPSRSSPMVRSQPADRVNAKAVFNNPKGGTRQRTAVENHIIRLVNGAPRGSTISVTIYQFSSHRLAATLVAAAKRRVAVRVVVDHKSVRFPAHGLLRRGLGTDRRRASWLVTCPPSRGCLGVSRRGMRAINHNKFFLFSASSGRREIVVQTSANATPAARDRQWNDALTMYDPEVYRAYKKYFEDLSTRRTDSEYHRSTLAGRYLLLFSPWPSRNPVVDVLNDVSCQGSGRIRVAMTRFSNKKIARKLARLRREGCRVEVIHGKARRGVRQILGGSGAGLGRLGKGNTTGLVHSKFMLIDAVQRGIRQRIVLTGSGNYTRAGLRANDEVIVGVSDHSLHDRYLGNFRRLSQMAVGSSLLSR